MKFFGIALFSLLIFFANGQINTGTLKVHVVDENGDDVLGANVMVLLKDKFYKGDATDPLGNGVVLNLEPGEYELEVTYVGYKPVKATFQIQETCIIQLEVKLTELKMITCRYYVPHLIGLNSYGGPDTYNTYQILKMPIER